MMASDQPQSGTPRRKEFQDGLRILTEITSWQLASSVLMMALVAGAIGLLLFRTSNPSLLVLGLLVLACVASAVTLRRQRRRLKLLREGLIEQMRSIIKQRAESEQFYGMATRDALTGLYNRRFGETRLQEEIARAERSGEPLILIAADFDRFKQINDQHGHAAGDLALKEFSRRLQRAVRACDVPIRVGGDEFLVIFPECTLEKIPEIMSRMESITFSFEGNKIPLSFSYGAAQHQPSDTPETILKRADERLYARKAQRKAVRQEEARAIVADAGFRRSERVPFETPVQVYVSRENEEPSLEEAKALSVNAHGALLALCAPVEMGQTLRLVNPRTQQEMECRVCRFGERHVSGVNEVGVEFETVAPTFWDVPSTPTDWVPACVPPDGPGRSEVMPAANAAPPVAPRKDAIRYLSDDVGKALRGSSSSEWNAPWVARAEGKGQQASMSNNATSSAPLSAEALSVLCDDMERVMDGSRPLAQNPQWAPRPNGERPDISGADAGVAPPLTDAMSVLWGNTEAVKDVTRVLGLEATWSSQSGDGLPKVSRPKNVSPELPSGPADALHVKGQNIIKDALQKLETPSEGAAAAAKSAQARTFKWIVMALVVPVVAIAVWFAMPRGFAEVAASVGGTDDTRSERPNQEAAAAASSQPGATTGEARRLASARPLDATVLGAHPCASGEGAPSVSSEMSRIRPRAAGVRLATKEDFDPEAVSWVQSGGQEVSSQIRGDFTGSGESRSYLWVGNDKSWHVVLLANNQTRCDVSLPSVASAAWVSKESINRIRWDGPAPEPSGDGLLIVGSAKDPASSVLLSLRGTEVVGSHPADYRQVPIGKD